MTFFSREACSKVLICKNRFLNLTCCWVCNFVSDTVLSFNSYHISIKFRGTCLQTRNVDSNQLTTFFLISFWEKEHNNGGVASKKLNCPWKIFITYKLVNIELKLVLFLCLGGSKFHIFLLVSYLNRHRLLVR